MRKADYSNRDNEAQMIISGALTKRRGLSSKLFVRYYRDVHGLIAARIPGVYQYWQHYLDPAGSRIFPNLESIDYNCPEEEQFQALSEVAFRSEEDRQSISNSTAAQLLGMDEQNVFESTIIYRTLGGNSKTYVDYLEDGAPNGHQSLVKLIVFTRQQNGVSTGTFRKYMSESFIPALATSDVVLKLRLHLLEEYDDSLWNPPNVYHNKPLEIQYQSWFEIVFRNCLEMRHFFNSKDYAATVSDQPKHIRTLHTFQEREIYTLVYNGQLTLVGQRSYPVADTIAQAGAVSQLQDEVVNLIYRN